MTRSARGRGHGKLVLCGEHAVVHGYPAIAFAVDRGTSVTLTERPGPTELASPHTDDRVLDALRAVLPAEGYAVGVDTDLPVGRGMGSSAALAVAVVRARAALAGEELDPDEVYERAMPLERVFHGNPSGIDVAVSARGGCLWFQRTPTGPARTPLAPGPWRVVVLDSGEAGNTAELVAGVASRRPGIDPVLARIGALVEQAPAHFGDPAALGALLDENHALLREIGVSNDRLDGLVALAKGAGAYGAKLAGAGGGGVVLALVPDPEPVLAAAERAGVVALECRPCP
ncbi:MAG: mevalonate kinase [Alphaproteobacteria bacterium]|nr:mevalonate kinase [Alphaproteobacteria bacterium]MCB9698518.1 mevalonate kinase [Alphaproteobacteria bacterium]